MKENQTIALNRSLTNSDPRSDAPVRAVRWLTLKVLAHSFLLELRRIGGNLLRLLPGSWTVLELPNRRLRFLASWVERQRRALDWWDRPLGPYYQLLIPTERVLRVRPKSVTRSDIHPAINMELDRVHPDIYLARLPHARVLGPTGVVITPDGQVIEESAWGTKWLNYDRALTAWNLPRCQKKSGAFYIICGHSSTGYYHWICEVLPRLLALDDLTLDTKVIVPANLSPWQKEALSMVGIGEEQTLGLDQEYFELDILYFPSYVGLPGNPHPRAIQWLREKLRPQIESRPKLRRLYITRRLAARRRVCNESELQPVLKEYGFEVIEAEKLTFREQINLFSEAEAVVGLHGAGLTNMVFAAPGSKVLEIFDPDHVFVHYYALADIMDHDYWYMLGQSSDQAVSPHRATGHQDIHVPVEEFAKSLDAMFR